MHFRFTPRAPADIATMRWLAGAIIGMFAFAWFAPYLWQAGMPKHCLFSSITGYPTPTCGAVRSVARFVRLDFAGSIGYNPLGLTVSLGGILYLLYFTAAELFNLGKPALDLRPAEKRAAVAVALFLLLALWANQLARRSFLMG